MAKSKKMVRRKKKTTLPLGVVLPMGVVGVSAFQYATGANSQPAVAAMRFGDYIGSGMTGYSIVANDWKAWRLKNALLPMGLGFGVHKLAQKLGVNRMLASAGVPLVRI